MRFVDLGPSYKVSVFEREIDDFNSRWPCSEIRGLKGVTFVFEKKNHDTIGVFYKNGNDERWGGEALSVLLKDARKYGRSRLNKTQK